MTAVLDTSGLGKKYGRRWALRDCTLTIPEGKVVGLVGPNGAGKTTLLHLAVGLLSPTAGTISVLGGRPADGPAQLGRVGFVAQDTPTYARMSVAPSFCCSTSRWQVWIHWRAESSCRA
jgi:ABC-2 type transport system ATP-binding protein